MKEDDHVISRNGSVHSVDTADRTIYQWRVLLKTTKLLSCIMKELRVLYGIAGFGFARSEYVVALRSWTVEPSDQCTLNARPCQCSMFWQSFRCSWIKVIIGYGWIIGPVAYGGANFQQIAWLETPAETLVIQLCRMHCIVSWGSLMFTRWF